jgi:acyl-CoA synthetase (NDP forming)
MDELQDLIVAVSTNIRQVSGRGVALFAGGGGGFAVLSADAIDREGLTVPPMPQSAVDEMREYIPVAGSSVNNPIDAFPPSEYLDDMLRLIATAEGMDMVFMSPLIDRSRWQSPNGKDKDASSDSESQAEKVTNLIAGQMKRLQDDTGTPVIGVIRGGGMARMMGVDPDDFLEATYRQGIASFPSVSRAARTVNQLLEWREYRQGLPDLS